MITEKDLKPGMKVKIPKTKSAIGYGGIEDSTSIRVAKEKNQDYLFYIDKDNEDNYYLLWHTLEEGCIGDFFTLEDIELYEETNLEQMKTALPKDNYGIRVENNAREIVEYLKLENIFSGNAVNDSVYYYSEGDWDCKSSDKLPSCIKVFTFEEFKTLKQMKPKPEKEIVGYKLIKPEYEQAVKEITTFSFDFIKGKNNHGYIVSPPTEKSPSTVCFDKLSEAGVLDLWFEPIFEAEKYEIGDWVSFWAENEKKNITSQIKEWTSHSYCRLKNGTEPFKHLLRKATPEEIKTATERHVDLGHDRIVLVNLDGIFAEGKKIEYKHINNLYCDTNTFGNTDWKIEYNTFSIGCWRHLNREDLKLILDAYEEVNGKPE